MFSGTCQHQKNSSCMVCPSREESIFAHISHEHLAELDKMKVTNLYKKGQVLFHEGAPALGVFCVLDGQVKILKNSSNGVESISRIVKPGEILGLRGVLTEKNHPASAKVMQDANICFIDQNYFKELIHKSPEAGNDLILKLIQEVTKLETKTEDLTTKSVRQRLAQLLLSFSQSYGIKKRDEILIDLKITRAEMASMIGTTPETVIRILSDFDNSGLIRQEGKIIYLTDVELMADELSIEC